MGDGDVTSPGHVSGYVALVSSAMGPPPAVAVRAIFGRAIFSPSQEKINSGAADPKVSGNRRTAINPYVQEPVEEGQFTHARFQTSMGRCI